MSKMAVQAQCDCLVLEASIVISLDVPPSQDFILPSLLYLTAVRPRKWVWVLNITIAILYAGVAVVGAVGAFKLIIEV